MAVIVLMMRHVTLASSNSTRGISAHLFRQADAVRKSGIWAEERVAAEMSSDTLAVKNCKFAADVQRFHQMVEADKQNQYSSYTESWKLQTRHNSSSPGN